MRALALAAAVFAATPAALAQDAQRTPLETAEYAAEGFGLDVGARAPVTTFTLASGRTAALADIAGENGLVIYFNRSLDWCPICLSQALEVDAERERYEALGYNLAILTYDAPDDLAVIGDIRDIGAVLLSDQGSAVIEAFGVRDPIYDDPNSRAYGVPYPIAFVIAPDGEILAKFWFEAGYGRERGFAQRITVDDVIAGLEAL